ncbi:MAG: hypothetical protein ABEJ26_09090 [Halosimplex sp.]
MSDADSRSFADSAFLTYAIPFAGSLLIAAGIAAGVVGGYAPVQQELGLCGSPTISVSTPAETDELTNGSGDAPSFERLDFGELTPAEQRAFEEAIDEPFGQARVRGEFAHRRAFDRGVVVRYEGTERYATLVSQNRCTSVDPLLFPLGVASILLGVVWILAPPMYRRLGAVERGRDPG